MEDLLTQIMFLPIRLYKNTIYYFDENGIYCSISVEEYKEGKETRLRNVFFREDGKCHTFFPWYLTQNDIIRRKAIVFMEVGDTIDRFMELLSTTKLQKHGPLEGLDRFICKIDKPIFSRTPENPSSMTFDFIHVDVSIVSEDVIPNRIEYIKKNKNEILQRVLKKVADSPQFKKYGVPINILRLSKITLIKSQSLIEIIFEVKS